MKTSAVTMCEVDCEDGHVVEGACGACWKEHSLNAGNIVSVTFLAVGAEEAFYHGLVSRFVFFFPSPISSDSLTAQVWC